MLNSLTQKCSCDEDGESCDCFLIAKIDLGDLNPYAPSVVDVKSVAQAVDAKADPNSYRPFDFGGDSGGNNVNPGPIAASIHVEPKPPQVDERTAFEKTNAMAPLAMIMILMLTVIVLISQLRIYMQSRRSKIGYEPVASRPTSP